MVSDFPRYHLSTSSDRAEMADGRPRYHRRRSSSAAGSQCGCCPTVGAAWLGAVARRRLLPASMAGGRPLADRAWHETEASCLRILADADDCCLTLTRPH